MHSIPSPLSLSSSSKYYGVLSTARQFSQIGEPSSVQSTPSLGQSTYRYSGEKRGCGENGDLRLVGFRYDILSHAFESEQLAVLFGLAG
jgi:hypothetical protein